MIFNSLTFIVFLILVVGLYWTLTKRLRLWLIFLSSLTFYGFWRVEFLSIVLLSTITDYIVALKIDKTPKENKTKRKQLLGISLILNLGLLIFFKYLYFISNNISHLSNFFGYNIELLTYTIILPLGISFYTFQTISYTVDVYRGHIKPEKDFVLYGSYVTFFPQLVAGPILRASEVINQLKNRPIFKTEYIADGLKRIFYGFFLKVVLADNIAPLVDTGYALEASSLSALDVWTLAFLFGLQIYFDFAGYSHIAIGCAQLMGISFPENFNFPYSATSFKDFWKRWHISLSSWIRDYLYLPLTGAKVIDPSKRSKGGIDINQVIVSQNKKNQSLFITWAIMGLWHGANWTFVLWGLFHALMIYLERLFSPLRKRMSIFSKTIIGWAFTVPLAMLGWILFRTQSVKEALIMYAHVLNPSKYFFLSMRENTYLITLILFLFVILCYSFTEHLEPKIQKQSILYEIWNTTKYAVMFILIFIFFRPINQFIYFQF